MICLVGFGCQEAVRCVQSQNSWSLRGFLHFVRCFIPLTFALEQFGLRTLPPSRLLVRLKKQSTHLTTSWTKHEAKQQLCRLDAECALINTSSQHRSSSSRVRRREADVPAAAVALGPRLMAAVVEAAAVEEGAVGGGGVAILSCNLLLHINLHFFLVAKLLLLPRQPPNTKSTQASRAVS